MKHAPAAWRRPSYLPLNTKIGQPDIVELAVPFASRRVCAIQAGGHVGVWGAALSAHFKRVLTFEPLPHLYRACVDSIKARNVTVIASALSAQSGHVRISVGAVERFGGSSAVSSSGTEFPAVAMDDLPADQVEGLGAIFLDIEGHELAALQGAPKLIQAWRPVIVVEENDKSLRYRKAGEVADYLAPFGYEQVGGYFGDLIFAVR